MTKGTEQPARLFGNFTIEEWYEMIKQAKTPAEHRANDLRHLATVREELRDQLTQAGQQFREREIEDGGRRGAALALVAAIKVVEELCPQIEERQSAPLV